MTGNRSQLALVGAFVLALLVSLVFVLALLAGRTGETDRYHTVYSNVAGLKFGSQVLYEGYPVGQVERIEPIQEGNRTRFRVELSITRGWKIPEDSLARPTSSGVLAPQTVSITAGRSEQVLAPGAMIRPAQGADLLSTLSSAAGSFDELTDTGLLPLMENLNRQVTRFGELLDTQVQPLTRDAGVIVAATAEHWPGTIANIERITAELAVTSARLNQLLTPERIERVDGLVDNVNRTAASLESASRELDTLVKAGSDDLLVGLQEFRFLMETFSRYSEPVGQSLDSTARNFQEFSRQLRQNPGVLLRAGEPEPPLAPAAEPAR